MASLSPAGQGGGGGEDEGRGGGGGGKSDDEFLVMFEGKPMRQEDIDKIKVMIRR